MTRHLELGRRAEDRAADHIEKSLGWKLLEHNIVNPEASKISNLTKISEVTLCKIFREIRILMSKECKK